MYAAFLTVSALVGALCAGFILAQSPRLRATQLAALLALGAAWWALCEALWNGAPDAARAAHWMRLSAPGWSFIGGLLPHIILRYFDSYPAHELRRERRLLAWASALGYAAGVAALACSLLERGVHGEPVRVPWGWGYAPGPVQLAFMGVVMPLIALSVATVFRAFRSPHSVSPPVHRLVIRAGVLIPLVVGMVTDGVLPVVDVAFPRLGSVSYVCFGLGALVTGLHFGVSFFTPGQFAEEILEALHDGVAMVTPAGVIRRANREFVLLTGRQTEALVGTPLARILAWEPPLETAVEDEAARLAGPDGESIPVSVSSVPLRDDRGNSFGVVVVVRDLREIETLRRQMLTQARLAAVGELAAGLAHEINNPLAFVRSNLAQLERHWKSLCGAEQVPDEERDAIADESREIIAESLSGVDRATEIVRGVRRFTHAGHPIRELADLNELVEDTLDMLRPHARSPELRVEFDAGRLPPVPCAPQELRQVLLNLLVNALDAVKGQGRIAVQTRHAGDEVVVEVDDDGGGIAPELLERIFDPFFTTKRVGEGTGLGLGIAWRIVHAHGGLIEVESPPGSGACFRVRLPLRAES